MKPNISAISRQHRISRQTLAIWQHDGIEITNCESVATRKSQIGLVRNRPKNAVPDEVKKMAIELSMIEGIGYGGALQKIKKGCVWPRKTDPIKTTIHHMARPSYWNQCIMTEYSKENRSFPDWSCLWYKHLENKKNREKWKLLSIDQKRAISANKKKQDSKIRLLKMNDARRKRYALRPELRTIDSLRTRFKKFFKGGKSRSITKLIGCTLPQFKKHLELQFSNAMTWKNYGSKWHIDHILPCSSFDHTDYNQVSRCWHWTNLRPLCAIKNLQKGKSITDPQMSLLIGCHHEN